MNAYEKLERSILLATSPNSKSIGGCIVASRAGMGKSTLVRDILRKNDIEFVEYSGRLSSVGVFDYCNENRTKVILLDDISDDLLENAVDLAKILLGRDRDGRPSVCSYRNNQRNESFRFEGRLLLLTNAVLTGPNTSVSEHLSAVLDRMLFVNFDLSFKQVMDRISELAATTEVDDVSNEDRIQILEAIKRYASPLSKNFSLRVWGRSLDIFRSFPTCWESFLKDMLQEPTDDLELVVRISKEHAGKTVRQQFECFREAAREVGSRGTSERYFFKVKQKARSLGFI